MLTAVASSALTVHRRAFTNSAILVADCVAVLT
jgi:hypothetical protein